MGWLELLISNLASVVVGTGGAVLYFRPKLKEANASAVKAQTDAQNYVYESLISRINSMEKMYNEQYAEQNKIIAELRKEVIKLTEEKFVNEKLILQLRTRIEQLEQEVNASKKK